ncbi:unnamed protein product [Ilex paraguariensis]|uniref:Uncharacterized protein n=1 Tax=Ilex paraguariensis TaxID=185542 RepID=A0ABC8T0A9_9AQUA
MCLAKKVHQYYGYSVVHRNCSIATHLYQTHKIIYVYVFTFFYSICFFNYSLLKAVIYRLFCCVSTNSLRSRKFHGVIRLVIGQALNLTTPTWVVLKKATYFQVQATARNPSYILAFGINLHLRF